MGRHGLLAGAVVLVAMSACGVDEQQSAAQSTSINSELNKATFNPAPRDCRVVSARTMATGTIRSAPQVGMLEVASVGSNVQSMYFETANVGPEQRRGVAEFELPALSGRITKAVLRFDDSHGWVLHSVPADFHTLSIYQADGTVTAEDFVRETVPYTTFATDMNDAAPVGHAFDITEMARQGTRIGARIELQRASNAGTGATGSGFDQFRIDLTVCNEGIFHNGDPGDPKTK